MTRKEAITWFETACFNEWSEYRMDLYHFVLDALRAQERVAEGGKTSESGSCKKCTNHADHSNCCKNGNSWVSVEERLPEESGVYLVYDVPLGFRVFYYGKSEVRSGWSGVTHWMPLPELPEDKGGPNDPNYH